MIKQILFPNYQSIVINFIDNVYVFNYILAIIYFHTITLIQDDLFVWMDTFYTFACI